MIAFENCSNCGGRISRSADGRAVSCTYCGSSGAVSVDPHALAAGLAGDTKSLHAGFDRLLDVFQRTLPAHTTVHTSGLLFKKVTGFDVALEELTFRLRRDGAHLVAQRVTTVRGITLSTEVLPIEEWLTELAGKLSAMASSSAAAREAFSRMSL